MMLWRKSVEMDKISDYYENCEKVSIRFVGHGHPFHNSAMRGKRNDETKGQYREKETRFAKQDESDWTDWGGGGGEKSQKTDGNKNCVRCSTNDFYVRQLWNDRFHRVFERHRWLWRSLKDETRKRKEGKREERSKFRAKLMSRLHGLYGLACRL